MIAGAAGLIGAFGGALIGGRAAVQGARISAEATAAVARYQMRIPAYRAFQISLDQFRHSLTSGEEVDVRALEAADQGVHANLHRGLGSWARRRDHQGARHHRGMPVDQGKGAGPRARLPSSPRAGVANGGTATAHRDERDHPSTRYVMASGSPKSCERCHGRLGPLEIPQR